MAKKVILKIADIQEYADISDNFTEKRAERFATRVQETQLRELLGDVLYQKLYSDLDSDGTPQTAPYIKLVDGGDYTYSGDSLMFFGLKPFLAFHWLAINTREGDLFQSDSGNINFSDNPQDNMTKASQGTLDRINAGYMKEVVSYRNNIVGYLNNNASDFPDWEGRTENKNKTGFNIITV